jgi:hypothetical protein
MNDILAGSQAGLLVLSAVLTALGIALGALAVRIRPGRRARR